MSEFDDRYVAYREHAQAQQRTDAELARLRERQATTEATLLHEVAGVRQDVAEMKQMLQRPQPADHQALVQHRALDTIVETLQQTRTSNVSPVLIALALIGSIALGALGMQLFVGR